jgi:DNA-binding XRE family transcriptional regulator
MSLSDRVPVIELPSVPERTRLRELFGVTKAAIGRELNVSRQTVHAWESGEKDPTGDNRTKYAGLLSAWADTESRMRSIMERDSDVIITVKCPWCPIIIHGTVNDIDSGLRKHLDYCESRPIDDHDEGTSYCTSLPEHDHN